MCNMLATTEHRITLQEDSVSLHQQFKIAGFVGQAWTCTSEWLKQAAQVGKGLPQAPVHELLFA